jgi:poly(hydroxyalkanoate) granule-associated protein
VSGAVKESAQQIWLAGLGAFSRAQEEGGKIFETLVQQGVNLQRKTQSAAEEKITEATQRMASMASDTSSNASGQRDKLEGIFEERVSRALNKLGVPSAKDVNELSRLVAQARRAPRIALALASGGPLGAVYEIGALCALTEAVPALDLCALDHYVGVSAGGFIAASLANGMTPHKLYAAFIDDAPPSVDRFDPASLMILA